MKRKFLVVGKSSQLGGELRLKIIAALKNSKLVTDKEQIEFLTLDVLSKIPQISIQCKTTHTLLIGLKAVTSEELVRRINYANRTEIGHFVILTEGPSPVFKGEDNAEVFDTLEILAKQDFSKTFKAALEEEKAA